MMPNSDIQGIYMGFLGRIDTLTGSRILGQLITVEEGGEYMFINPACLYQREPDSDLCSRIQHVCSGS